MTAERDPLESLAARAEAAMTVAELAVLLRELRRREARERQGRVLTYQQLVDRTGWSIGSVSAYLTGVTLPPTERFDELLRHLGARPHEHGLLATARDRIDDAGDATRVLSGRPPARPGDGPARPARMLPALPRHFTGRSVALARLDSALAATPGAVVVTAVAGMGGVGKTTLAVHWGHSTGDRFPGGQLYVNLRGYDPGESLSTVQALGILLSGLAVPPPAMPTDEAGRLALYHTLLRGQRTLVVLDNARASAQVQPLLPPAPCLALVTSRDDLADLRADGDLWRIRLDVFAEDEAVALLHELVGARADDEPEAVRSLAKRCGYLPLALRVVAELAASRPDATLTTLVDELEADFHAYGLDAFATTDDLRTDLRAVISWSVRCLPAPAARAMRLLGLVPGNDIDEYGLAALADVAPDQAADLLTTLRRAHLVEPWPPGRYSMHDVVRAYARTAAARALEPAERHAATTRLLDYYLAAATAARTTLAPPARGVTGANPSAPTSRAHLPGLAQAQEATAWVIAEYANVVAGCVYAARNGWPVHAVRTAVEFWALLDGGHDRDAVVMHTAAVIAADQAGSAIKPSEHARVLAALALAHFRLGDLDNATQRAEESIAVSDRAGEMSAMLAPFVLGSVHSSQGRFAAVAVAFERGLAIGRALGPVQHGNALVNLGELHLKLERYDEAAAYYRQAADLAADAQVPILTAEVDQGVAAGLINLGRFDEAVALAERAVAVNREYGQVSAVVYGLDTLALAHLAAGRPAEAIDHLAEAVEICRTLTHTYPAALILNTLGETYRHGGDHALALASHEEALDLAERAPDRYERTRALVGLGDAHAALGDFGRARVLWSEALDEYTEMGLPAAARVQARLDGAR